MIRCSIRPLVLSLLLVAASCRSDAPAGPSTGTGGSSDSGGEGGDVGSTGGVTGTGGSRQGGTGGTPPMGGGGGSGGARDGSASDAAAGGNAGARDGSASDGAAAGSGGGDGGAGQGGHPAKPSAGCGKANPPVGARTIMTGGRSSPFMVSIPTGYDPTKPYPLGFAFHGFNLTEMLCFQGSQCGGFRAAVGDKAIVVVPKSLGPGWETPMYEANVKLVEDLLALVKAEYCVDESRVFMAGVSSGGQFLHRLGCRMGDQLWAASPIAAYLESAATMNCKGSPPQVIIHGISDMLDGGKKARDHYAMKYGCRAPAGLQMAEDKIKAALAAQRAEFACVDYEGCQSPLRWCMHSQIIYSGLTHGWPNVGGQLIADFLNTLK